MVAPLSFSLVKTCSAPSRSVPLHSHQHTNLAGAMATIQTIYEEDEDASELLFSGIFGDARMARPMLIAEVGQRLEEVSHERMDEDVTSSSASSAGKGGASSMQTPQARQLFEAIHKYAREFGGVSGPAVQQMQNMLHAHQEMHPFVRVQLGNLALDTTDEARSLLPSLIRDDVDEENLQTMLDNIIAYRQYNEK